MGMVAAALADAGGGSAWQGAPEMSGAMRDELAPGGQVRAALNLSNTLLVSSSDSEPVGVAPDLAREMARRARARVEFVTYANAGLVADAAASGAWDVAFIGAEPERADHIAFTSAYVEIDATFIVRGHPEIRSVADVDRPGMRVASAARAAYTLFLARTLRHATIVEAEGLPGAVELFATSDLDALAGLRPRLFDDLPRLPGARLLEGRFTAVQQSVAVPRQRLAAADYAAAFVSEIKRTGLLRELIDRHGVRGLTIA